MNAVARPKKIDPTFGQRLRALREHAGLTLVSLGERVGMSYQNVARLERGEREPTWSTFLKLAAALDVSLDEFRSTHSEPDSSAADVPSDRPLGKRK